jgi:hypothetical protein
MENNGNLFVFVRKKTPPSGTTQVQPDQLDFNIDEFLKMDSDGLNGLGLGSSEPEEMNRGSKASRWFGNKSQQEPQTSASEQARNSAAQQEQTNNQFGREDAARSLLEMLQKGSQPSAPIESVKKGTYPTAEELESNISMKIIFNFVNNKLLNFCLSYFQCHRLK